MTEFQFTMNVMDSERITVYKGGVIHIEFPYSLEGLMEYRAWAEGRDVVQDVPLHGQSIYWQREHGKLDGYWWAILANETAFDAVPFIIEIFDGQPYEMGSDFCLAIEKYHFLRRVKKYKPKKRNR